MHVVSLEVKGLKSLRDAKIDDLGHYSVFIGKNDSGKSCILQAVKLLGALVKSLSDSEAREVITDKEQRARVEISAVFRLSDSELAALPGAAQWQNTLDVERLRLWRYDLEMREGFLGWGKGELYVLECGPQSHQDYGQFVAATNRTAPTTGYNALKPELVAEVLRKPEQSIRDALVSRWPGDKLSGPVIRAGSEGREEAFYVILLRTLVGRMRALDAVRSAVDEMEVAQKHSLGPSGENLTQVLETWRSSHPTTFRAVEQLLMDMFPDIARLHLAREGTNTVIRVASGSELQPLESFRLSNVGMGVQQALVVGTAVLAAEDGAIVLLEEPENNLHPAAQRVLAGWLRKHAVERDKQLLISTHSTIFASTEAHCSAYLVVLDDDKGTRATKIQAADQPLVKQELGIRNVDLYGYNGVVLWEGDSEAQAMPLLLDVLAEKAGTSVHALGLTSRNLYGHSNTRLQAVRQFLGLLDDLDIVPYVVMDDDEGVKEELDKLVQDGLLPEGHYHVWERGREIHGRNPGVGCEFEDNFSNEQLIQAAKAVAQDAGVTAELSVDEFAERCAASTSKTGEAVRRYYHEVTDYGLSKPDLARKLGDLVAPEIKGEEQRTVTEYEFEKVARDIFRKLGGFDVEDSSDVGRQE